MAKPLNLKSPSPSNAQDHAAPRRTKASWRVLIVDDEEDVHAVTKMILGRLRFKDRAIETVSAYSAEEAKRLLREQDSLSIVLLDVVMETDDAGLKLVEFIRDELGNKAIRIILRTGQPGQAPEESVIVDYDINDYKAKSELTAQRLVTTVVTALRSYETIRSLERNWNGLQRILDSTETLFQISSIRQFASGVLAQLSAFLGCQADGIMCVEDGVLGPEYSGGGSNGPVVLAACGNYAHCLDGDFAWDDEHGAMARVVRDVLQSHANVYNEDYVAIFLGQGRISGTVALLHGGGPVGEEDRRLLEVFTSKISIALANAVHYQKMISAEQAATTDFLTGLNNRRQLLRLGMPLLAGAKRSGASLAVAMLDIDRFKSINDTWGHDVGDAVLVHVAHLLRDRFRDSDIVARFGGEEFCVVAPLSSADQAFALFDGVREAVAQHPAVAGDLTIPVTISVGVTVVPGDSLDAMISEADKLLYKAKQAGRNRTEVG